MILGVGVDIVQVSRIEKNISSDTFLNKAFTAAEREYFSSRNNNSQTVAGYFAGKEAVAKALGTGFRGFGLTDIEINKDEYGKPMVLLKGKALERAEAIGVKSIHLSISHEKEYAVAYAIAEN